MTRYVIFTPKDDEREAYYRKSAGITFVLNLPPFRFQCEFEGKKQTFECQQYHLLQVH